MNWLVIGYLLGRRRGGGSFVYDIPDDPDAVPFWQAVRQRVRRWLGRA